MTISILTNFFLWCTIINGSLLVIWTVVSMLAPDIIYSLQSKWFPIRRDAFDVILYCYLGLFKIFFIVFNLVPYLALLIVG